MHKKTFSSFSLFLILIIPLIFSGKLISQDLKGTLDSHDPANDQSVGEGVPSQGNPPADSSGNKVETTSQNPEDFEKILNQLIKLLEKWIKPYGNSPEKTSLGDITSKKEASDSEKNKTLQSGDKGKTLSGSTTNVPNKPPPPQNVGGKVVLDVPKFCQINVKCPRPKSACGPTALAMAIAYYNKQEPGELASKLWNSCRTTAKSGSGHQGLVDGAKEYGFPNAKWSYSVNLSWIKKQINAGKPIVAHVSGHYVVVKGFDKKGNVYLNDPGKGVVNRVMPYDQFSAWWTGGGKHAAMVLE